MRSKLTSGLLLTSFVLALALKHLDAQQTGWVDFRDPDHYALRGGGPWELKILKHQGTKYLFATNVGGPLMRCVIPDEGSSEDPVWTSFIEWIPGCCIDVYANQYGHFIGYGTFVFNLDPQEGFFWSDDNGQTWTLRNVPDNGGWVLPGQPPDRYFVQDVAILKDPETDPGDVSTQNYWTLLHTVPRLNDNRGIYHYYDGPQGLQYYYEPFDGGAPSHAWKIMAELNIDNPDSIVAYACGNPDETGGYGLWRCVRNAGAYDWSPVPASADIYVEDIFQDEDDFEYLFISVKYAQTEEDEEGDLYLAGGRGTEPWQLISSYWTAIGQYPGGHARDIVADYHPATGHKWICAAVGAEDYNLKGPWRLIEPYPGTWEHLDAGLSNSWPNREMLIHDPDDFARLYWGSWGGGVFEYEPGQPWVSWDKDYNAEFDRSLVVDRKEDPDVVYVANQGWGIWKGTAESNSPYRFTHEGAWAQGALNNQQFQQLENCPWDDNLLFTAGWDVTRPLFVVNKSTLSADEFPGLGTQILQEYDSFIVSVLRGDDTPGDARLYMGVKCLTVGLDGQNQLDAVQIVYLDENGFHLVDTAFPYPDDEVPISDITIGSNGDLWVVTGEYTWQQPGTRGSLYHFDRTSGSWANIFSEGVPPDFYHSMSVEVWPRPQGDQVFMTSHSNNEGEVPQTGGLFMYDYETGVTVNLADAFTGDLADFREAGFVSLLLMPCNTSHLLWTVGLTVINNAYDVRLCYAPPPFQDWTAIDSPVFDGKKYLIANQNLDYSEDHNHLLCAGGKVMEFMPGESLSELTSRWNLVSLNVDPWFDSLGTVLGGLGQNLVCAADVQGNFYYPDSFDQIGIWQNLSAYRVKTVAESGLNAWGDSIAVDTTFTLMPETPEQAFNLIAYLPSASMPVDYAFGEVNSLIIIKNGIGEFWSPDLTVAPFNLEPGMGYSVAVSDTALFAYPPPSGAESYSECNNPVSTPTGRVVASSPQHFQFTPRTIDFYPIAVEDLTLNGAPPRIGDELGVFTPNGLCVGAAVFEGFLPLPIAAWRDDPTSPEIDGYLPGDPVAFKLFNVLSGLEINLQGAEIGQGSPQANPQIPAAFEDGYYGRFALNGTLVLPDAFNLDQNFPNPFNSETVITYSLPYESVVKLEIYDLLGRRVAMLAEGRQPAGVRAVRWRGRNANGGEVANGVYFLRIRAYAVHEIDGQRLDYEKMMRMVVLK